ncbi:MAG: hypothetical protein L6461_17015, partial [Anaerolineae bacterium]|nr:hypothetical protein [Anaerolineae bacterium]
MAFLKMSWTMKQKNKWMLCFMFWAFLALSACTEQVAPSSISPEALAPSNTLNSTKIIQLSTETLRPSKTPKPTNTLYPTWTPKSTTTVTAAPNLCVKNPVPSELLISKPTVENNKLIAFSSKRRTTDSWGYSDIYTIAFDGSNLKQLTTYSGDDDMYRCTPDGKQILFHSDRNHELYEEGERGYLMEPFKKELFIINVDGTGSKKVTAELPEYSGRSPDGR